MEQSQQAPEFYRSGGKVWAITGTEYQPAGTVLRVKTESRPEKVLQVGRNIKKTVWIPTTKDYKLAKIRKDFIENSGHVVADKEEVPVS